MSPAPRLVPIIYRPRKITARGVWYYEFHRSPKMRQILRTELKRYDSSSTVKPLYNSAPNIHGTVGVYTLIVFGVGLARRRRLCCLRGFFLRGVTTPPQKKEKKKNRMNEARNMFGRYVVNQVLNQSEIARRKSTYFSVFEKTQ